MLRTTPDRLPTALVNSPVVHGIFEIRFPRQDTSVAELLPGFIFAQMSGRYTRSESTPVGALPAELRPHLGEFAHHSRLIGENGAVNIGDRVVGVSALEPYEGWAKFRPRIRAVMDVVRGSGLVPTLDRFSLKFTNVLPAGSENQLALLNVDVTVGEVPASDRGFALRCEVNDERYTRIVEIQPRRKATIRAEVWQGVEVGVDCIRQTPTGSWDELDDDAIEDIHRDIKQLFFGLTTTDTINSLGPSYS